MARLNKDELAAMGYTDDAEVYVIREPDPINPDCPVLFHLDVTLASSTPVLMVSQPGPWSVPVIPDQVFVELDTLIALGRLAESLKAGARG